MGGGGIAACAKERTKAVYPLSISPSHGSLALSRTENYFAVDSWFDEITLPSVSIICDYYTNSREMRNIVSYIDKLDSFSYVHSNSKKASLAQPLFYDRSANTLCGSLAISKNDGKRIKGGRVESTIYLLQWIEKRTAGVGIKNENKKKERRKNGKKIRRSKNQTRDREISLYGRRITHPKSYLQSGRFSLKHKRQT